MAEELSGQKKIELWKAFHPGSLMSPALEQMRTKQLKLATIQQFYDTDDIFRREIDGLRQKMEKKKLTLKEVEKKTEEFLREAEYRRYIATFEHMKENFDARKKEMAKIQEAFV